MVVVTVRGQHYHMDDKLVAKWDKTKDGRLAKYDEDRFYIVDGAEGCLTGDTKIIYKRGRTKGKKEITLKKLYSHFHKEDSHDSKISSFFNLDIPTFIRSFDGKGMIYQKIKDVLYSGEQMTYLLTLNNDRAIKATANHKFLTNRGWVELKDLVKTDKIMVNHEHCPSWFGIKDKPFEPVFSGISFIDKLEISKVYDIECEEPHHNFVANGIVVHNSGKSLFTLQQAAYIDETILDDVGEDKLPRICFSVQEFLDAIRTTKSTIGHTKVIVFDEAFRGLSSKSSLSKNNKLLVTALMEARQNNLIVFLVTPSFYLLEFYGAVLRSQALFHVIKEKKTRLRYVRVFNKKDKAILYQIGVRKGWGYPRRTKFRVRFFNLYPGGADFEKRYRQKKSDNFGQDSAKSKAEIAYFAKAENYKEQRDKLLYILKQNTKLSYSLMSKELKKYDIIMEQHGIGEICRDEAYKINKGIHLVPTKDKATLKIDGEEDFEEEEEEDEGIAFDK